MSLGAQRFPAVAGSVGAARRFAVEVLEGDDLECLHDDARSVVSELATNAVLHARTPFTVTLTRDDRRVRIAVADGSPARPRPSRLRDQSGTTGRGLRIVADLSAAWGVEVGDSGKTVWCALLLQPASSRCPDDAEAVHEDDGALDLEALLDRYDDRDAAPRVAT